MKEIPHPISKGDEIGACPSCSATISKTIVTHPEHHRPMESPIHPMPYCHYFGVTDPDRIVSDIRTGRAVRRPE